MRFRLFASIALLLLCRLLDPLYPWIKSDHPLQTALHQNILVQPTQTPVYQVLVFTKTMGFRHSSIAAGISSIKALGDAHLFHVDTSEDSALFNDAQLAQYQVIIFLNTSGDILNDEQQEAFQRFIRAGGGFIGIHSATDTEYGWPWYGELVGTYFGSHPPVQSAAIDIRIKDHPSTIALPNRWERTDEWYNFQLPVPLDTHILANLDETSYSGGSMGSKHPISWAREFDGGRVWYTAMGHTADTFQEPLFLEHLLGGIEWAVGEELVTVHLPLMVQ